MTDPENAFGRLYYVEIPALDVPTSAEFYRAVFGWTVRQRGDGETAFDDGAGAVSGTWSTERTPADDPGFRLYISVENAEASAKCIEEAGGTIITPPDMTQVDVVCYFRDPAGNLAGIHQYNPGNAE